MPFAMFSEKGMVGGRLRQTQIIVGGEVTSSSLWCAQASQESAMPTVVENCIYAIGELLMLL